jgi:hypothetical protein
MKNALHEIAQSLHSRQTQQQQQQRERYPYGVVRYRARKAGIKSMRNCGVVQGVSKDKVHVGKNEVGKEQVKAKEGSGGDIKMSDTMEPGEDEEMGGMQGSCK